jgi:hypothetical protein
MRAEDPPSGEYFYLHVVESGSDDAVPLPRNILDATRDLRWALNRETGMWGLLD